MIVLDGLDISSKSEILEAAFPSRSGGTWIDLSRFGGGTINLRNFPRENLRESDFWF